MANTTAPRLLKINEAAEQLGVSRWQIYKLMDRGELAWINTPGPKGFGRKVEQAEINAYIERNRASAKSP